MRVWAWLTQVCPADGKIRLATLELSCLLLKQQVVASTGCIIKDVHLACLEVRPVPAAPAPRGGRSQGSPCIQVVAGPSRRKTGHRPPADPLPTCPHGPALPPRQP